ncbi:zinc finger MYND domain-containing protein 10-like [Argopecten irradians]|uniref:zinc finger MYND domain-containing protein 10-like n=1 Tax=Argopecten irradians TaxID=31199 RepID=UPI00371A6F74
MSSDTGHVLMSVEAEAYVERLVKYKLRDVGSSDWSRQHEMLEKLNMQAVMNASAQEDEFVKDFFISFGKFEVLIYDLLVTEVWKDKIFSALIDMDFEPKTTFPIYMVLYHEATVATLLETTMFFRESCENAEDQITDLVDYCYRKLTQLVARTQEKENMESDDEDEEITADSESRTNMEELQDQDKKLTFEICIKVLSLLRYIVDHIECLPLSVLSRVLNTHDIPILLVQLVENPPWSKRKGGKLYKFIDNKWQEVSREDSFKLTKTEGQVWLALFQLLMNQTCQQKYDLNSFRKNIILKLRSYLTEIMLDQLPVLAEMQRYLEHLSMMDPPAAKKDLILEQVPEIRDKILSDNEGKWKQIAKKQSKTHFNPSQADIRAQAKRWADTYNFDMMQNLLSEPPKCAVCGNEASKRCSRCQNEWYCRRECQVNHWAKHKKACYLLVESMAKDKAENKIVQET